jgi:tripartite ATP-independent transporter DctP family solute receptor
MAQKNIWVLGLVLALICFAPGCPDRSQAEDRAVSEAALKAPSPKPEPGQLVFRLAETLPVDYPATIGDLEFARLVEERSRGRIKIIVYYDARFGEERSAIEQIQFGGVDFARVNSAPLSEFYQPLNVLSLPYLFRDGEHLRQVLYGPIGDEILAGLSRINLVGLTYYSSATRNFYTKQPVRALSDMKGLRIRVQQSSLYMDFIRALGAEPVPLPFGEVYNGLLLGEIDGAENNWSSYYAGKHYQIAPYYLVDTHARTPEVLMANRDIFNQLDPADQELIRQAARDSATYQWQVSIAKEAALEAEIRKQGITVIYLSEARQREFQRAAEPIYLRHGRAYRQFIDRIRNTTSD